MPVPMLDLKAQYASIKTEIDTVVAEVFAAQQFRGGPHSDAFESAVADYVGVPHAIGVASGTDALYLALKALDLQPGDEVITSPFTFFATAGAIVNAGGTPVFADIDPVTYTLDPKSVEARITGRTRVIMPVHLYGQCADMDALAALAAPHAIPIIEDAAQAIGARYSGRSAGAMGLMAALSFYPTKNLGAAGEGGMILTTDDDTAKNLRMLRCHGASATYVHEIVGTNSHLHALQAAVLNVKLRHLDDWNAARRQHADYYTNALNELFGIDVPVERSGSFHVYHQYVVRVPQRDACRKLFTERGIGCGVFYPVPLHRQECFAGLDTDAKCPEADRAALEVLALPMYPELTATQQDEVVAALRDHVTALS
jgi:dTDP-4-amino-4,6-dideoxygalactose transaminase